MTREELQREAIEIFLNEHRVALEWGTGVGKSLGAIKCLDSLDKPKVLLLVAERAHIINWQNEFTKWNYDSSNVTIVCYASLKNYVGSEWDVIIMDECHHATSDVRLGYLETIKADYILALSATISKKIKSKLDYTFGTFKVNKVSLQDAIDSEILSEPKIYLIPLTLDNTVKSELIVEEWGKKTLRKTIKCTLKDIWTIRRNRAKYPNVRLEIAATQKQKYNYLTERFNYYKARYMNTRSEIARVTWLRYGSQRKAFLGEIKTPLVKPLLNKLKDTRYICFCASINQAKILGKDNAIHSERTDSLKVINKFNNKEINSLYAVGMATEGQNLTDIQAGVIIQLDGQERIFTQKSGRVYRADDPVQYIFYYKNTRDEEYLQKVLEDIDPKYIKEYEICN